MRSPNAETLGGQAPSVRLPTVPTPAGKTKRGPAEPYAPTSGLDTAGDLAMIYAGSPGLVAVTTLPDRRTRFYPATDLAEMAAYITASSATQNTYVMVATLTHRPQRGRGGAADTAALPGVVLDLDVAGPGHADVPDRLPLPADRHEALGLIDEMPVAPTVVYDTGHGLLVRYLFTEPMVFVTATDRDAAADLAARWNAHAVRCGRDRGVHVDNVGDLARLTRPVGSWNRKGTPAPVWAVECHPERRYRPEELAEALPAIPEPPVAARPAHPPIRAPRLDGRESPAEAFTRCVPWSSILAPAGFDELGQHGEATWWRHPAASSPPGTPSATTDANGSPVLVVHSESTAAATGLPAGPGQRLTKFRTWAVLHYRGDEAEAARALRAMAWGRA